MKLRSKIFYWYSAFVIAFAALTLLPKPDSTMLAKYHLSVNGLRGLDVTIIILEAFIWFIAFYGYDKLHRYQRHIRGSSEGASIGKVARGLLLLSAGLPVSALISSALSLLAAHSPSFLTVSVIIKNYIGLVFPLLAFGSISFGARGLSHLAKTRPRFMVLNAVVLLVLLLGVVFCCLIVLDHKALRNTYHMSPELVMLTLGLPSIYTWFLGLFATAELQQYSSRVVGIVYKKGWNMVIKGLGAIILISIALQYLTTLSSWLTSLSLGGLLVLIYMLLLALALAYVLLAMGAKRLMRIEEA